MNTTQQPSCRPSAKRQQVDPLRFCICAARRLKTNNARNKISYKIFFSRVLYIRGLKQNASDPAQGYRSLKLADHFTATSKENRTSFHTNLFTVYLISTFIPTRYKSVEHSHEGLLARWNFTTGRKKPTPWSNSF